MRPPAQLAPETQTTRSNFWRRGLVAPMLASLALATGHAPAAEIPPVHSAGLADCLPYIAVPSYRNHEYEVCTAYVANATGGALGPFYKFGNNSHGFLAGPARRHFETRYWEGARRTIEQRVAAWPTTRRLIGNHVSRDIDILSVAANLKADRALIRSSESWRVTNPDGKTLYRERGRRDATLCRGKLPGVPHVLHEWVVVKFNRDANYDCLAFDRRHHLQP